MTPSLRHFLVPALILSAISAEAQITLNPLSTFGVNGWLAPGASPYLGTANNERGLGFGNGHVYLVSRTSVSGSAVNVRMLNQLTGADLGGLNTTGISGGTFAINTVAVGGDGVIYVNNLTTQSGTTPFTVYKWTTEGSAPTIAYTGTGGLSGARVGDTLAAFGSGSSTRLVAGYGSTPAVAGNNGYAIIDPTAGSASAVGFTGTPPNAGDFRLGLTFVDSSHVIGTAGSSLYRYTSFSGTSGTLLGSPLIPDPAGATADRLLAYDLVGGHALLAVASIGDFHVSLYDVTDPNAPVYIASRNNTTGALAVNSNASGQLAWGDSTVNPDGTISIELYAMSSNQGIQAFIVTIPEPSTFALAGLGLALLAIRRKVRR